MLAVSIAILAGALAPGWQDLCAGGDWKACGEAASAALAADSSSAEAWALLALARGRGDDPTGVLDLAETALSLDSSSSLAWVASGTALSLADEEGARTAFMRAYDIDPGSVLAVEGLARLAYMRGEWEQAVYWYEQVLGMEPMFSPAYLPTVRSLALAGETGSAIGRARAFAAREPGDADLAMELADLYASQGRSDSAEAEYVRAVALDPGRVEAYRELGLLREDAGDMPRAVKYYRELLDVDPSYFWALGELGWCLEALGLDEAARQAYLDGLETEPDYAWAAYRLGLLDHSAGMPDSARAWFDRALEIDPSLQAAWVGRGILEEDQGNLDLAMRDYSKAIELDSTDTWSMGELGFVYEQLGMYGEAGSMYETAVRIDPSYQWAWEQRGLLYETTGDRGGAIAWYRLAAETAQPSAWLLGELGMLLEEEGDADSAALVYRASIEYDPLYSFGTLRLARIERDRGDLETAAELLSVYMGISGDSAVTAMELSMLEREAGHPETADSLMEEALAMDPLAAEDLAWSFYYGGREDQAREAGLLAGSLSSTLATTRSMADLMSALGEHELSDSLWSVAVGTDPGDPSLWMGWGMELSAAEEYDEAAGKYLRALELDSTLVDAAAYLGESYLFRDMYPEAGEWLEKALSMDPASVYSICYLGLIRERQGDPEGALELYLEALRISPGYSYAEDRIRSITDPGYDLEYWRGESGIFSSSLWLDMSVESGNTDEESWDGGVEAAWRYGPGDSRITGEFSGSLETVRDRETRNAAWASLGIDYFLTDVIYARAKSTWDRQPDTVRPWQVSSFTSLGYREWLNDWLYLAPEAGVGMVASQWYLAEKRSYDLTAYLSLGVWMNRENSLLPSLWLGASFYLPPDDMEDSYAYGNAEIGFDAFDRLDLGIGCNLDFVNRPAVSTWEKLDTEIYTRLRLSLF